MSTCLGGASFVPASGQVNSRVGNGVQWHLALLFLTLFIRRRCHGFVAVRCYSVSQ